MAEQTLEGDSFLANLSPQVQEKVLSLGDLFHYAAGEVIFREGHPSLFLYIVKTGRIAVEIHVPAKGRRPIMTVGPGDVFSWSALVEPRIETASARALEATEAWGIKGGALSDLCREDCAVGFEVYRALAGIICARLNATRSQLPRVLATG
jgi:CRP/FNR family cyclic AMP-dependent transcriptional regulator